MSQVRLDFYGTRFTGGKESICSEAVRNVGASSAVSATTEGTRRKFEKNPRWLLMSSTLLFSALSYASLRTLLYSTLRYSILLCSSLLYSTLPYSTLP